VLRHGVWPPGAPTRASVAPGRTPLAACLAPCLARRPKPRGRPDTSRRCLARGLARQARSPPATGAPGQRARPL